MNLLKTIRANEWWGYKFPPILLIVYLAALQSNQPSVNVYVLFGFILLSLTVGAIYVSILNDITDIEEDYKAGKNNRMANYSSVGRSLFLLASLALMGVFCIPLLKHTEALLYYLIAYLCFTLYSAKPFRFKHRGLPGIFADASGSQLFPTLYVASASWFYLDIQEDLISFLSIGVWSLSFGLRGILYHQFNDKENDKQSGINTLPQIMTPKQTLVIEILIATLEVSALCTFMILQVPLASGIAFTIYALFLIRLYKHGVQLVFINRTSERYTFLMSELYQVILPLVLLVLCVIKSLAFLPLFGIHLLLFGDSIKRFLLNTPLYRLF